MASIGAIGGAGLPPAVFEAQVQAAATVKLKESIQEQGEQALKLIQSAAISDPQIGRNLDASA
jgi:hypothetical protein